ncbi:MAG: ATP-binding protein [Muribaculaceae bacterium]|nr:ATP-binding protein [Muribaculaceae bacterium]
MDKLFERHDSYLSYVPMEYVRELMGRIDWEERLVGIRGSKGVGKSTLMLQYIKQHYEADDRHVLYCSADMGYFATHTLVDTADRFVREGGKHLFIDEVHKYPDWSREVKEIYDLHRGLRVVVSGSSLIQLNDGQADLSRRMVMYDMAGLSFREFLHLYAQIDIASVTLDELLEAPNAFCTRVRGVCHPLEFFRRYLQFGFYPYFFESKATYLSRLENVVNYIIDVELTGYRALDVGNTRSMKALLQVISRLPPYEVDIAKLSRATAISRPTVLKYLRHLEEANLLRRVYTNLATITDLQKPDKLYMDNTNLLYLLSSTSPDVGTVRETFLAQQLASAKHIVEYAGYRKGDFRVDRDIVIEVGGAGKGFAQIAGCNRSFVAVDDTETASRGKIPLWAFGFLY